MTCAERSLGEPRSLASVELGGDDLLDLPTHVHDWRGDWRVGGFGGGHVRVGAFGRPSSTALPGEPVPYAVLLVDLDRTSAHDVERIVDAGVVLGARGFAGPVVELPATLFVQHAHTTWRRAGARQLPDRRFLAVVVDGAALVDFADGDDVAFYAFFVVDGVRHCVNRDGVPRANFTLPLTDLHRWIAGATPAAG